MDLWSWLEEELNYCTNANFSIQFVTKWYNLARYMAQNIQKGIGKCTKKDSGQQGVGFYWQPIWDFSYSSPELHQNRLQATLQSWHD